MGIIWGGTSPLPLVNSPNNMNKPENSPKWGIAPKCSKYNVSTSEHDDTWLDMIGLSWHPIFEQTHTFA
jgi:hypothetical protein